MRSKSQKKSKTVLIVTSHYPPNLGGVESHLQALVSGLAKRGWGVLISTYQPLASKINAPFIQRHKKLLVYRFPWLGFNIVHKLTPYPPLELLYLFPGLFVVTLLVLIKHHRQIRVIHAQGLVPTAVGAVLRVVFQKRLVSSIHNMYFFPKSGAYKFAAQLVFNQADMVLAPTKVAADELIRTGVNPSRVGQFRYWLDLNRFKPTPRQKAKQRLNFQGFTVFFVGRLIETKGVAILLKMVKDLNQQIELVIAGDGSMRSKVEQAALTTSNLRYLGRIENDQLPSYYSAADLLVVPSTVDEGWGFVAMEAISCGTPVVASKKGGLSDVVSPQTGVLVAPSAAGFRKLVEDLYQNADWLHNLGDQCRGYALKHFGEDNVKLIIDAYEKND